MGPVGDFLDHGSLVVGTGFPLIYTRLMTGESWQELGHGPFDGPFSFFPGMAMSIAGSQCGGVGEVRFFFVLRRRAEPVN